MFKTRKEITENVESLTKKETMLVAIMERDYAGTDTVEVILDNAIEYLGEDLDQFGLFVREKEGKERKIEIFERVQEGKKRIEKRVETLFEKLNIEKEFLKILEEESELL